MSLWDKLFTEKCKEVLNSKHEKYISASLSPRASGYCAREQIAEEYYAQADRIAELEKLLQESAMHNISVTSQADEHYARVKELEKDLHMIQRHYDLYRDWETDRKSTRLNSSHRL